MLWVTRPHPHIDRTACAWLIRRFVDPAASFAFAPDADSAGRLGGTPFDMRDAALGHHEDRCSFETILATYGLADPALHRIAAMVHDADLHDSKFRAPEAPGLDAVIRGLGLMTESDHELLGHTERVYDGLLAWIRRSAQ